jgi:hypothetical protein
MVTPSARPLQGPSPPDSTSVETRHQRILHRQALDTTEALRQRPERQRRSVEFFTPQSFSIPPSPTFIQVCLTTKGAEPPNITHDASNKNADDQLTIHHPKKRQLSHHEIHISKGVFAGSEYDPLGGNVCARTAPRPSVP